MHNKPNTQHIADRLLGQPSRAFYGKQVGNEDDLNGAESIRTLPHDVTKRKGGTPIAVPSNSWGKPLRVQGLGPRNPTNWAARYFGPNGRSYGTNLDSGRVDGGRDGRSTAAEALQEIGPLPWETENAGTSENRKGKKRAVAKGSSWASENASKVSIWEQSQEAAYLESLCLDSPPNSDAQMVS